MARAPTVARGTGHGKCPCETRARGRGGRCAGAAVVAGRGGRAGKGRDVDPDDL